MTHDSSHVASKPHGSLQGLIPILATPFGPDGTVDQASLRRLVRFELGCGVDGVGVFGIAGEGFSLTEAERDGILAVVVDEIAGEVPIVAGAGGTGVLPVLEQAQRAVEGGADALMILPPHLIKPSPAALVDFFGRLGADAGAPVMVQNAPTLTGVGMPPSLLAELGRLPGVDYVKIESQPTAVRVGDAVAAVHDGFGVLGGQNALFCLEEFERGAIGTMPGCEFPDEIRAILDARAAGDFAQARRRHQRLLPLLHYGLQPGIAWAVHKEVLHLGGIIDYPAVRLPAQPLDRHSRAGLREILADLDLAALRGSV
jgi:2-keto-3-deoxy-L-arabinonate dehydratase